MFETVIAICVCVSAAIFLAHAVDGYKSAQKRAA
jgi:hypothetical protein